ncbi:MULTISPECIES: MarR family winged helix-turn-helix transcriptional regulator [Kribbella]|uniref:DNA-binding MarR family transcriptional regulator n=1 Tax=Kribbella pratensis TaxID=2512112 RepID=A0ABY2FQK2_9ACTN|nr:MULTISPECIES: MarR family transcriptional regulator [Kribbella]TDW95054.1 DNA-binding MarR family transcriptional regulator [Kribbella pratensis]TDX03666.1 DNA-binding MarR family transcriptional regulator [Kribbella sp. VKM Ac-2566]
MRDPDDAAEQIAGLLDGIVRRQRRASREGFGESVTHGQFRVLRTLDRADRLLRLSELAAQLGIVPRSATSVVDDLEAAGLVARQPDPHDRRATLVYLTPDGLKVLATLRKKRRDVMAGQLARLTADEQQTLADLLQRLAEE